MGKSSAIRYDPVYCRKLAAYAVAHPEFAATNKECAKIIGCSDKTIIEWKKTHKEFKGVMDELAIGPDLNVECAIYKSACGYYVEGEEKIISQIVGKDHVTGKYITKPVSAIKTKKYIPPNAAAQNLWAYNRLADKYKRRVEQETKLTIAKDERADEALAAILAEADAYEESSSGEDNN